MQRSSAYPVSVVLIAHNEARNLERCLASVTPWTAGIVVVINDCTDDTAGVARRFGAHVHELPWTNFRDQKNHALAFAQQPWILALDADEVVSDELRESIHRFLDRDDPQFAGASFARKTWFMGRWITHGDWYPDRCLRLFRREKGRWSGTEEHAAVALDGRALTIPGDLLHFSFPDIAAHLRKQPAYAQEFFKRQVREGTRWSGLHAVVRPCWRFVRAYFLRLGFLDGYPGFYIAFATAFFTLYRYSLLYEHQTRRAADDPRSASSPARPGGRPSS